MYEPLEPFAQDFNEVRTLLDDPAGGDRLRELVRRNRSGRGTPRCRACRHRARPEQSREAVSRLSRDIPGTRRAAGNSKGAGKLTRATGRRHACLQHEPVLLRGR